MSERDKKLESNPIEGSEQAILIIISASLVLLGQSLVQVIHETERWPAYTLSAAGMLLFLLTTRSFTHGKLPNWFHNTVRAASQWLGLRNYGIHCLWAAPIFSLGAWLAAGDGMQMKSFPTAFIAWIISIGFLVVSHWDHIKQTRFQGWSRTDTWAILALSLFSLLLRGIALDRIPWLLTGDEGSAGLSAVEFINGTRDNIFGTGWFSFPAMFFAVQSLSIRILGQTITGLRFPSMIAGALTIPALYFFCRVTFGRKAAIMSSAFLATFHFHIHFSRIGLNNIWDGLFILLFSAFLWWAWKTGDQTKGGASFLFLLAGLTLGLGQYFYTSMRVVFAMLGLWLLILAIQNWTEFRKRLPGLVSLSFGTLVIVLPLAAFYYKQPAQFTAPFQRVSILGPWLEQEIIRTGDSAGLILASQFKTAAQAFTHVNLRHWYKPSNPMLLLIPSALFLLGIVLLLVKIKDPRYKWIIVWIISAITISALSESTPASQRLTFVAPAVSLVIALPLMAMIEWFGQIRPKRKFLATILVCVLLVAAMGNDLFFYFVEYSGNHKFGDNNTETANAVAEYLLTLEKKPKVYFCGQPRMGYYTHSTIPYLAPEATGYDVSEPIYEPPSEPISGQTIYIFLPERLDELEFVRQAYPDGRLVVKKGIEHGLLFTAYQIE